MSEQFRQTTAANGVTYLECPALGAPHGFSTRLGGESAGPFAELNLGVSAGDDEATVRRNRARFAEALALPAPFVSLHQVHGATVHVVAERPGESLQGDAVITRTRGLPVSVFTADCTPVLLHDPAQGAVAAVHAGWRGTVAQVVVATLQAMAEAFGSRPADVRAAIGPAIGPCCFEVGEEVVAAFAERPWAGWEAAIVHGRARPHVDLHRANADQLHAAGVPRSQIFTSGLCTVCDAALFYSWRRDAAVTGRMQAVIAPSAGRPA